MRCQVFDELPADLFGAHDLPCDLIITPTEVFRVSERLPKPEKIIWGMITREKFQKIDILKEIQFKEKRAGNDVRLMGETDGCGGGGGSDGDGDGEDGGGGGGAPQQKKKSKRKPKKKAAEKEKDNEVDSSAQVNGFDT